ncbi:transposable element Tcb2 transposase [Trichonephila clavipes]|nr:transposable element Tcb2 transposase [Trichonephila clavipes]
MAQKKHLDDFLRGRIIGRLECGRTQLEVSEELGIAQSVISRLWQRFQEDATGTTVSRQTVCSRLGHIGLYARRPVRCVPFTTTHCRLRLTWSREHALWTPQQWSCGMFSDESRFSFQSDSRRTLIWRAPGTRYHQENTIERHRYGGAGWLVWGGIILGSRTDLHFQSETMTGHIYRDVILEQHVRLFRGAMGAEFLFMDDNARSHRATIVDECLQSEDITRMDWPAYSPDMNPIEHVWDMRGLQMAARQPPPTCLPELRRALLDEWCNIPQDHIDNLILSMPRRCFYNLQATIRNGQRCSAAKAYLAPIDDRTNLDIVSGAFVKKVMIDDLQAKGVMFDFQGRSRFVRANKEVIMAAGTTNTAQLLMLSGVGPKEELRKHRDCHGWLGCSPIWTSNFQ